MNVRIIIPYFGTWPPWMYHFLNSCRYNPDYTWHLFADTDRPVHCPPNVLYDRCSLPEFNRLAGEKLGLEIGIRNPYKLCDLRPAFGNIFSDHIKNADFWGYSDLDLIYGDISQFLAAETFENYDVISVRENYLAGHFALFRNTDPVNKLYKSSPVHAKVFEDHNKHYSFDERSNLYGRKLPYHDKYGIGNGEKPGNRRFSPPEHLLNKIKFKMGINLPESPADMNSVIALAENRGEIRVMRKDLVRSDLWYRKNHVRDWKVEWNNGKLFDLSTREEFLHFHFIRSKHKKKFVVESLVGGDRFRISARGIRPVQ